MDDYRDMHREFLLRQIFLTGDEVRELKRVRRYKKFGEDEIDEGNNL